MEASPSQPADASDRASPPSWRDLRDELPAEHVCDVSEGRLQVIFLRLGQRSRCHYCAGAGRVTGEREDTSAPSGIGSRSLPSTYASRQPDSLNLALIFRDKTRSWGFPFRRDVCR